MNQERMKGKRELISIIGLVLKLIPLKLFLYVTQRAG